MEATKVCWEEMAFQQVLGPRPEHAGRIVTSLQKPSGGKGMAAMADEQLDMP
jgi:hypothetical protein